MDLYLAFTLKSKDISKRLITDIFINLDKEDIYKNRAWRGVWDTGATRSAIDKRIVDELNLTSVGKARLSTANGEKIVNTYRISMILPNEVIISNVLVSEVDLGEDCDLLVGMDIISKGDFSITNKNGETVFSFRTPSIKEIDYVKESKKEIEQFIALNYNK